jgi:hypothetical protein
MGTTLHNKIHLGRSSVLGSRRVKAAFAVGLAAGVAIAWLTLR